MKRQPVPAPKLAVILIIGVFVVSACAAPNQRTNWSQPGKTVEERAQDLRDCRAYARRQVERDIGLSTDTNRPDNIGGGGATYNRQIQQYDRGRLEARELAYCMRRLGYTPTN